MERLGTGGGEITTEQAPDNLGKLLACKGSSGRSMIVLPTHLPCRRAEQMQSRCGHWIDVGLEGRTLIQEAGICRVNQICAAVHPHAITVH